MNKWTEERVNKWRKSEGVSKNLQSYSRIWFSYSEIGIVGFLYTFEIAIPIFYILE